MGIRDLLAHLTASEEELVAEQLRRRRLASDAATIDSLHPRRSAVVVGTIAATGVVPGTVPVLEATVEDGTGQVVAVFLGRRAVPGIEEGRSIELEGLVVEERGRVLMRSPRYRLLS